MHDDASGVFIRVVFKDGHTSYTECLAYSMDDWNKPSVMRMVPKDPKRSEKLLYLESCKEVAVARDGRHEFIWRDGQCIL